MAQCCITVPASRRERKILYVDTEQGKNHCQIVLNRILKLAGLPKDCDAEVHADAWEVPAVFQKLQEWGNVR